MVCFIVENKLVEIPYVIRLLILVFYRNRELFLQLMGFRIVIGTVLSKEILLRKIITNKRLKIYHYENQIIRSCISCIQFHGL